MSRLMRGTIVGFLLVTVSQLANAAAIGLTVTNPDVGGAVDTVFDYVPAVTSGNPSNQHPGYGQLSITGDNGWFVANYTDEYDVLASPAWALLDLTADFDASGLFIGGTVSVTMDNASIVDSTGAVIASGTDNLLTASLDSFGFFGEDNAGFLEFEYTLSGGNWSSLGYGPSGGIKVGVTMSSGAGTGIWDADPELFQRDWNATGGGNNINVFTTSTITPVPAPAALWLMGSGLLLLTSLIRKR